MSSYIDVPVDTDPQDILQEAYDFIQAQVPGWVPADGNLDTWLLMALSSVAAESRDIASAVPTSIFRYFGAYLVGLPPIDDAPATTTTTWTMVDNLGYTVPAGTQVSINKAGDDPVAFVTVADAVVAPGSTVIAGVQIIAVEPGADASGLGVVGGTVNLEDPLAFVASITQQAATSGGVDAETDDAYLGRLTSQLQLLAPRPILPADFSVFARNIAGVHRATTIDGYNPIGGTFNNPRMVAVAVIDESGLAVSAGVKAAVAADLQARREVNFVVNVIDPTQNLIDVTYQVKALAGYDLATLVTSINAALSAYLSPATWGVSAVDPVGWSNLTVVRYLELAQVINGVPGVDYITTTAGNYDLTVGIHGGALARADVALTGVAPLPLADVLTGVAT